MQKQPIEWERVFILVFLIILVLVLQILVPEDAVSFSGGVQYNNSDGRSTDKIDP